jgi:hypothetical protein
MLTASTHAVFPLLYYTLWLSCFVNMAGVRFYFGFVRAVVSFWLLCIAATTLSDWRRLPEVCPDLLGAQSRFEDGYVQGTRKVDLGKIGVGKEAW